MQPEVVQQPDETGRTANPRRRRWRRAAVIAVAVVAIAVLAARLVGGDDGPEPRLPSLDIAVADAEDRWAAAAGATGVDPLPVLRWELDEGLGLEVATVDRGSFGTIDLYRHPGGALSGVDLLGRFATEEDRARFRSEARAAVAAVLGVDDVTASRIVGRDLGLDATSPDTELEVERDGVRIVATRSAATAQLRISAATVEEP